MTTPSSPQCPYPNVRRVVTGHEASGKAIFVEDSIIQPRTLPNGAQFTDLFRTEEFPVSNAVDFVDKVKEKGEELTSKNGSTFRVVDIAPGSVSPFHRTISLDYAAVLKGTVICQLDDGKQVTLNSGDVLVQRGTIHAWINNTDEWVRTLFVMEDALPVEADGKTLPTVFQPLPDGPTATNK